VAELLPKAYFVNSKVRNPFSSYEIDIGILIERDSRRLLIIETTSYYHWLWHLKNKFLNYSALRRGNYDKFLYIYLTLGQGISARLSEDRIEQIVEGHSDLGTFASIFANNKDLELLSLPRDYKDIDTNIKRDWWDKGYLEGSYRCIIEKLDDLTEDLAV